MLIFGFLGDISFQMSTIRMYDCIINVLLNTNQAKVIKIPLRSQNVYCYGDSADSSTKTNVFGISPSSILILLNCEQWVFHQNSFTVKIILPTVNLELWGAKSLEISKLGWYFQFIGHYWIPYPSRLIFKTNSMNTPWENKVTF